MNYFVPLRQTMKWNIIHIEETDSTNRWLRNHDSKEKTVVVADYQTAGRGCGNNTWESENGKNLLFSLLFRPDSIAVTRQFHISMAISLAICEALDQHIGDVSIKWPNDIYWRNGKICGILIENSVQGGIIRDSIAGVGLNVNQRVFHSNAPNPVSLWQICEQETDCEALLSDILQRFDALLGGDIRHRYLSRLYRREGFHPYADANGAFMAEINDVLDDGHLVLHDDNGNERRYAFKEVQFII